MSKLTVNDVAARLGCAPQTVRLGLQRGEFPFGAAIKTSTTYTYIIYPEKLKEFIG